MTQQNNIICPLKIRSVDTTPTGHTVEGVAVPFDRQTRTFDGLEQFDNDCQFNNIDTAKLLYQHDELIGTISQARSEQDGLHITANIANTATGRDVVELLRTGALSGMSVGFIPINTAYDDNGVAHQREVNLLEVSLVTFPAYQDAQVTNQRTATVKEQPMTNDNTNPEMLERMTNIEEQMRSMATEFSEIRTTPQGSPLAEYRSFGELLKAVSNNDSNAMNAYDQLQQRDVQGATVADTNTRPQWIKDQIKLVQSRRNVFNLFTHAALPAQGLQVNYLKLGSNTTTVTQQAAEYDKLPFGKITLDQATAEIKTYGGYTTVSRQVIERSDTPYLDTLLKALTLAYADATEKQARTVLKKAVTTSAAGHKLKLHNTPKQPNTFDDWIALIVDAAEAMDKVGGNIDVLAVTPAVFKELATLSVADRPLMDISGRGADTAGDLNLTGITGNLLRVPVQMLPTGALDGSAAVFLDKSALTVWESANAPFQLQQDNNINLSRDFSVYGYAAFGETFTDGIIPVDFTA